MDFDILGFLSILFVTLLVILLAKREPSIASILYVALTVRILAIILNQHIMILPDGIGDATRFEVKAYEWSRGGFLNTLMNYPGFTSFFISWIIAIFYSIFGQSEMMGQSISLLFGVGAVYLGWIIARKLWDQRSANKVGWAIALFPTLILYSCIILREAYIYFFLLLALNGIVDWVRLKNFRSFILVFIGFIGATFFHSAMIVGLFVFLTIIFLQNFKIFFLNLAKLKISIKSLLVFLIIISSITLIKEIKFHKITPLFASDKNIEMILAKIKDYDRGTAKYPSWVVPETKSELFYKSPFRVAYFVFSPFPWDIKKPSHLVGMFDALLYIFLTYLIFQNRKIILTDPTLKIILIILLSYIIIYGVGVGNFGTGIRHRAKFAVMFILLAAPLIPKFIFSIKNRINK